MDTTAVLSNYCVIGILSQYYSNLKFEMKLQRIEIIGAWFGDQSFVPNSIKSYTGKSTSYSQQTLFYIQMHF